MKAQEQGLARIRMSQDDLLDHAVYMIGAAQAATDVLMSEGCIPPMPED
jgi:hypothetical protein